MSKNLYDDYNPIEREVLLTKLSVRILSSLTDRIPEFDVNKIINKKAERFEKKLKNDDKEYYENMIKSSIDHDGIGRVTLEDPSIGELCYVVKMLKVLELYILNVREYICNNEADYTEKPWSEFVIEIR